MAKTCGTMKWEWKRKTQSNVEKRYTNRNWEIGDEIVLPRIHKTKQCVSREKIQKSYRIYSGTGKSEIIMPKVHKSSSALVG